MFGLQSQYMQNHRPDWLPVLILVHVERRLEYRLDKPFRIVTGSIVEDVGRVPSKTVYQLLRW